MPILCSQNSRFFVTFAEARDIIDTRKDVYQTLPSIHNINQSNGDWFVSKEVKCNGPSSCGVSSGALLVSAVQPQTFSTGGKRLQSQQLHFFTPGLALLGWSGGIFVKEATLLIVLPPIGRDRGRTASVSIHAGVLQEPLSLRCHGTQLRCRYEGVAT